jgi:hypothetical protein
MTPSHSAPPAGSATTPLAAPVARARLLRALALAPAAAFLLMVLAPPLNHDVAAILNFAERWIAGERLYRDLIDVNPPLIFVPDRRSRRDRPLDAAEWRAGDDPLPSWPV